MWRSIYRRLQANLQRTEAEVDEMLWREAIGWFECWRECPPASESLARIAAYLGAWKPPADKARTSSEQELIAFAMLARGALG